jgi:hypothetical protein
MVYIQIMFRRETITPGGGKEWRKNYENNNNRK